MKKTLSIGRTRTLVPFSLRSWAVSLLLHLLVPCALGAFLVDGSRYAVASSKIAGSSENMVVELVSAAPDPVMESMPEPIEETPAPPLIQPEMVKPLAKKIRPSENRTSLSVQPRRHTSAIKQISTSTSELTPEVGASDTPSQHSVTSTTVSASPDYLRNPPPPYPRESRLMREEGTVLLSVGVSSDGSITNISISRSSRFERLDNAAVRAVTGWKFKPATIAGLGVSSSVLVPVTFVLK